MEKKDDDNAKLINDITAHVNYLASDELEGRGVETEGINKAADYIVNHFSVLVQKDSYNVAFQPFEIQQMFEGEEARTF